MKHTHIHTCWNANTPTLVDCAGGVNTFYDCHRCSFPMDVTLFNTLYTYPHTPGYHVQLLYYLGRNRYKCISLILTRKCQTHPCSYVIWFFFPKMLFVKHCVNIPIGIGCSLCYNQMGQDQWIIYIYIYIYIYNCHLSKLNTDSEGGNSNFKMINISM